MAGDEGLMERKVVDGESYYYWMRIRSMDEDMVDVGVEKMMKEEEK